MDHRSRAHNVSLDLHNASQLSSQPCLTHPGLSDITPNNPSRQGSNGHIVYIRDQLFVQPLASVVTRTADIPSDTRRISHRGECPVDPDENHLLGLKFVTSSPPPR
ncbi:hypothetical protein INR49_031931 [Caranx melampygus]|nr:hypothetical protein INR49_031931 [Caranx melampygus]